MNALSRVHEAPPALLRVFPGQSIRVRNPRRHNLFETLQAGKLYQARAKRDDAGTIWFVIGDVGLPMKDWLTLWHSEAVEIKRWRKRGWEEQFNVKKNPLH